jgi:hypothetical protein
MGTVGNSDRLVMGIVLVYLSGLDRGQAYFFDGILSSSLTMAWLTGHRKQMTCPSPGAFESIAILYCATFTLCTPQTGGFESFFLKHDSIIYVSVVRLNFRISLAESLPMNINLAPAGREMQTMGELAAVKELQGLKPGLIWSDVRHD